MRAGVLLLNFGGPQGPDDLEPFLRALFLDVLPLPAWLRAPVATRVARRRAAKIRPAYEAIGWSPLVTETEALGARVADLLSADDVGVAVGMQFTAPTIAAGIASLENRGVDQLLAMSLYPHWSFATSGSAYDALWRELGGTARLPVHFAAPFYDRPWYLQALASAIRAGVERTPGEGPVHLLFSAHGLPRSFVRRGDPYPDHVKETVRRVVEALDWSGGWDLAWQSRVGPSRWLEPSTEQALGVLAKSGAQRVTVVPVAFVGEHIETLWEIDRELAETAHRLGIRHFGRAPAVGNLPGFAEGLAAQIRGELRKLGQVSCVRCLAPKGPTHAARTQCADCGFRFPAHQREHCTVLAKR